MPTWQDGSGYHDKERPMSNNTYGIYSIEHKNGLRYLAGNIGYLASAVVDRAGKGVRGRRPLIRKGMKRVKRSDLTPAILQTFGRLLGW